MFSSVVEDGSHTSGVQERRRGGSRRSDAWIPSPAYCFSLTSTNPKPTPPALRDSFHPLNSFPSIWGSAAAPQRAFTQPNVCFVLIDSRVERPDRNMCQVSPEIKNTNSNCWDFLENSGSVTASLNSTQKWVYLAEISLKVRILPRQCVRSLILYCLSF